MRKRRESRNVWPFYTVSEVLGETMEQKRRQLLRQSTRKRKRERQAWAPNCSKCRCRLKSNSDNDTMRRARDQKLF